MVELLNGYMADGTLETQQFYPDEPLAKTGQQSDHEGTPESPGMKPRY